MEEISSFLAQRGVKDLLAIKEAVSALAEIAYKTGAEGGITGAIALVRDIEKKSKVRDNNLRYRSKKEAGNKSPAKKKWPKKIAPAELIETVRELTREKSPYVQRGGHINSEDIGREPIAEEPQKKEEVKIMKPIEEGVVLKGEELRKARQKSQQLLDDFMARKEKKLSAEEALLAAAAKKVEGDKKTEKLDMAGARGAYGAKEKNAQIKRDFESFWADYPSAGKKAKPRALLAYVKARLKETHEKICQGRDKYAAFLRKNPTHPAKHGATWLNDEGWNDYDEEKRGEVIPYEKAVEEASYEIRLKKKTMEQKIFLLKATYRGKWEEDIKRDINAVLGR